MRASFELIQKFDKKIFFCAIFVIDPIYFIQIDYNLKLMQVLLR